MKCIIIDDEPLAIEVLKQHIEKIKDLEIIGTFSNAMEAFTIVQEQKVDLMFLDIQMPKLTGIDFLKTLHNPPQVILTTAYREYALEGYELDVVDYLIKPIPFDRFLKALSKAFRNNVTPVSSNIEQTTEQDTISKPFVYVKVDKTMVRVELENIIYVESLKNYVRIKTKEKRPHHTSHYYLYGRQTS